MKVKKVNQEKDLNSGVYGFYRKLLFSLVKRPILSIIGVIGIFYVAMKGFAFVENIFFPGNDTPIATIEIETPEGSPIARTIQITNEVEQYIQDNLMAENNDGRGFVDWGTYIGEGPPRFSLAAPSHARAENYSMILANISDVEIAEERIFPEMEAFIQNNYPDVNPTVDYSAIGYRWWCTRQNSCHGTR